MNAMERIAAALAAPNTHAVVTTYADGCERLHETRSAASAETYATGERRKIGRDLINRKTGATVRVVSVDVVALQPVPQSGAKAYAEGYSTRDNPFRIDIETLQHAVWHSGFCRARGCE